MSRPLKHEPILNPARPKGEQRPRGWGVAALVLATLLLLGALPLALLWPREQLYLLRTFETASVARGTLTETRRASGTLVPRLQRSLLAPGEGVLAEWLVAEGDEVTEGTPLGALSSPKLQDEVRAQQAALEEARRSAQTLLLEAELAALERESTLSGLQNTLAEAERTLGTTERLFDLGASSRAELEAARAAHALAQEALTGARESGEVAGARQTLAEEGARATVAAAERALLAARAQVAALELRAPLTGRVLSLKVGAGDTVETGALLATLASPDDLRVEAALSEAQAQGVGVGQRASITVGNQTFAGSVAQVAPQAQTAEGGGAATVPVVVSFDEPPQGLRIGASTALSLEVGRREGVLYLPRGPFLSTGDERFVYVVEGERATRQPVRFGLTDGDRVEVEDGLGEGARVVVSSYEAFKDRQTIRLAPEGELREP